MTILDSVLALSYAEQDKLINDIYRARRSKRVIASGDAKRYIDYLCDALGVRDFDLHTRKRNFVWVRTMAAYKLYLKGYTMVEIADMMGLDHSSISHYLSKMDAAFEVPMAYAKENEVWNKFNKEML